MKINSIHINNYGALSNVDYHFDEHVTSFCEDNGYGKTTIVSFIKAMFYGLESVKSSSKEFLDRKHFYPFNGGTFGGSLSFTYNNKEYRIERTFDVKSETKDTLKVYVNNNETDELGDIPGEKIFGINKDSFERLICFNADKIAIETDNDINKKLNNYIENIGKDFDIDAVIKKIKELKKNKDNRLSKVKEEIKETEENIRNLQGIKETIGPKYQNLSELNKKINEITKHYDEAAKASTLIEKWNTYDQLVKDIEEPSRLMKELEARYTNGFPSSEEIDQLVKASASIKLNEATIKGATVSEEDYREYRLLKEKYKDFTPSKEDIERISASVDAYYKNVQALDGLNKEEDDERINELEYHFASKEVSKEEVDSIKNNIDEYSKLLKEIQGVSATVISSIQNNEEKKPANKKLFILLTILSILLIGGGVGLIFVQMIVGIIVIALGAIGLIVDIFLYINMKFKQVSQNSVTNQEIANPVYQKLKEDIDNLKNRILISLAAFRYKGDDPLPLFYRFERDAEENKKYLLEKGEKDKAKLELVKSNEELKEELTNFFKNVSLSHLPFDKALETLKNELVRYETLKKIVDNTSIKESELKKEIEELKKTINNIFSKYQIPSSREIDLVKKDSEEHIRLIKQINELEEKANYYKKNNALKERPIESQTDFEELSSLKEKLLSEHIALKHEIEGLEDNVSSLDDEQNRLIELQEEKKELDRKIKIYKSLMEEIEGADNRLKEKYVAPIRDRFVDYAKLIEDTLGEKVHMDSSYRISFEREGMLRSYEHLSSGILSICSLCFRLALFDNMFNEEKPFVIMDDPFVSLDETRFNKTKELIKKLSKDKQIIYFSCHPSRDLV